MEITSRLYLINCVLIIYSMLRL